MSEREVDAFGRVIPTKRPLEDSGDRQFRPPLPPYQRSRSPPGHEWKGGRGGVGNDRHDSRDRRGYNGRDDHRGRGHSDRGYNDRGFDRGGRHYDDRKRFDSRSPPRTSSRLQPMKSYKNFILTQRDDATPDIFQRRYDEYQLQYLQDASNFFFEKNKCEEWFRDRYDPSVQQLIERESKEWSRKESKRLLDKVSENCEEMIRTFRLCQDDSNVKTTTTESDGAGDEPGEYQSGATPTCAIGHHFDGHVGNTIYLAGIPPKCTKLLLSQAIKVAIAANAERIAGSVERVCLAQPTWNFRGQINSFDRTAWIVMSAGSKIQEAVKCLRDARILIPGPVDLSTGESVGGTEFKLQASVHSFKEMMTLPHYYSYPDRISFDCGRATELGYLLDKERGVDDTNGLNAILSKAASECGSALSEADKLDICIAYLRRVHFFVYYSGKRFRDEAHLLAIAPNVVLRRPDHRATGATGSRDAAASGGGEAEAEEGEEDKKEEESEEGEDDGKDESRRGDRDESEGGGDDANTSQDIHQVDLKPYQGPSSASAHNLDRRIEDFIRDFRRRIERIHIHQNAGGDAEWVGTVDEEDAKIIFKAQDKVMEQVTNENCEIQPDGKARCGLAGCTKLFKGKDFLQKHIRNKHPEVTIERLVRVAEKYMLSRFNGEDLVSRPLPPVEVESGGGIEMKSVRELYEAAQARLMGVPMPMVGLRHVGTAGRGRGRGDGGRFGRGGFDRRDGPGGDFRVDRRGSGEFLPRNERRQSGDRYEGARTQPVPRPEVEYQPPKAEDNHARRLHSYQDVDSPMDMNVDLDYGVAVMPPPKKRRLIPKA